MGVFAKYITCALVFVIAFTVSDINSLNVETAENGQTDKLLRHVDMCFRQKRYTAPEEANAYDLYKKVLELDPSHTDALKRIYEIFDALLNRLSGEVQIYAGLIKAETEGRNVKMDIVNSLTDMIATLGDCGKICREYPRQDSETARMCEMLKDNTAKYTKMRSFYQQKLYK